MTRRPPLTSMHDVLAPLLTEDSEDSNELLSALSIASARFEESGGKLDRITKRIFSSRSPKPSASTAIQPTLSLDS
jgi:hypothetical protein